MEQFFNDIIDVRDELARPGPAGPFRSLVGYFSITSKDMSFEFENDVATVFKLVLSNFKQKVLFSFKTVMFVVKPDF